MSNKLHLNAIVTKALLDSDFEEAILNGKRKECLDMFELDQTDKSEILAIDADVLDQFIRDIDALSNLELQAFPVDQQ
ncbi:MAG: hypothetical protein ISR58_06970 [Anaerolineales bacterium]|nr:hypothetical protein [Chloroflexota bacterium]MBL6980917.1 hypothetical protein [Anaerolineales bacterium]